MDVGREAAILFLLALTSSSFSLCDSLSPSSQVSRGALSLLRYDGSGRVLRGYPDVLVSSCLSPWRHELEMIQRMRRLTALRSVSWRCLVLEF